MKKLLLVLFTLVSVSVYADVFGTARTLRPGAAMIGIEPQFFLSPTEFEVNAHIGYGIIRNLDVDFRFGVGSVDYYVGGDLEYRIFHSRGIDFSLSAGAHYQGSMFVDITPNISFRFRPFSIYTGADMNWMLAQNDNKFALNWFLGADIPIRRHISIITEFGINFIGGYPHWISMGGAFYF